MPQELTVTEAIENALQALQTLDHIYRTLEIEVTEFNRIFRKNDTLEKLNVHFEAARENLSSITTSTLEGFASKYDSSEETIKDLNKQIEDLKDEKKTLSDEKDDLENDVNTLNKEKDKLENEIYDLTSEIKKLEDDNEILERDLENYRNL